MGVGGGSMYRLLSNCLMLLLLATVAVIACLVLGTAGQSVGPSWLAEGGLPPALPLAHSDGEASPDLPAGSGNASWHPSRLENRIHELRASLLPHDKLIAATGDDTSIVFFTALATSKRSQDFNYSRSLSGWRQKVLDINKMHCMRYGHPVVLRLVPIVHSRERLATCNTAGHYNLCVDRLDRQTATWGKIAMMRDMLQLPGVSYALSLDADAVFAHMEQDTMRQMARLLDESQPQKDLLLANEDWRNNGRTVSNTGMMFARSTSFTRQLFSDMARAFNEGSAYTGPGPQCQTNEQDCLSSWKGGYPGLMKHVLAVNSTTFNFNPCAWFWCPDVFNITDRKGRCHSCRPRNLCPHHCGAGVSDPGIEVIHFMGDSRFYVDLVLPLLPQP